MVLTLQCASESPGGLVKTVPITIPRMSDPYVWDGAGEFVCLTHLPRDANAISRGINF